MFPSLHIQITDLDPHAHYCIILEMTVVNRCRYKYSSSGGWAPAGMEEAQSPNRIYLHPDSPATGKYWMSQPISFGRLKLTNTLNAPHGQIVLTSMHKYQPKIIIAKTAEPRAIAWAPTFSITFKETQFIAVTAYQNDRITKLKIDNNPFAKGFRENGQSKCKRKNLEAEKQDEEEDKASKRTKLDSPSPLIIDEDRLSCSSSSSAEASTNVSVDLSSPMKSQSFPLPRNQQSNYYQSFMYPFYPSYGYYSTPMWGTSFPFYYHSSYPSHNAIWSPIQQNEENMEKERPRKLTDFSIRAITGCL
ncbi:unnamed protein product [Acanthoscelides obtectus]|nr:unnamed protein product [Acanthoscelides obtectus]CAK1648363.1 T-box transcription factor TBX6 [Acanthoscelides obtectus]